MRAELVVRLAPPGATVQDAGRTGWLAAGVPPSGPLDPDAHAAANLAAGNERGAAALEIPLGPMRLTARGAVAVSLDGEALTWLADGQELVVQPASRAVRYLAVAGGIEVPVVLGSRSTLLAAALGGLEGRMLRPGDVLPVGSPPPFSSTPPSIVPTRLGSTAPAGSIDPTHAAALTLWPGPHLARLGDGAIERLLSGSWRVSPRSDRVGTRLEGDKIPRRGDDRAPPVPMLRGAIQITTDGTPIVLGPDHPVTGGYPVLAILSRDAQAQLARLRPGRVVTFVLERTAVRDPKSP